MTKKKILLSLIAVLVLASFCACGSKTTKDDKKKTVTTEKNEKEKMEPLAARVPANSKEYKCENYSLSLPENWAQLNMENVDMAFGETKTASETFTQTINVLTEDITKVDKNMSVETYLKFAKAQLDKVEGCKVVSTKLCTINGYDGGVVVSDMTSGQVKYKCEQAFIVHKGKAYVISFLGNNEGGFDNLVAEAEGIFNSFKIQK